MRRLLILANILLTLILTLAILVPTGCESLTKTEQTETTMVLPETTTTSAGSSSATTAGPTTTVRSTTTTTKATTPTTAKKAPAITRLTPDWCTLDAQGAEVVVTGTGFTGVFAVTFGGTQAMDYDFVSDKKIIAYAPIHSEGAVDVQVITPAGMSKNTSADDFTYVDKSAVKGKTIPAITRLTPSYGPMDGGVQVVITGTGFVWVSDVTFGGISATFTVNSSTKITAVAPAWPGGTVPVQVVTLGGMSADTSRDDFTYR